MLENNNKIDFTNLAIKKNNDIIYILIVIFILIICVIATIFIFIKN